MPAWRRWNKIWWWFAEKQGAYESEKDGDLDSQMRKYTKKQ